jgi:uncharacterized membrane protein YfcA
MFFERIREYKLLILGCLIGIIGSLIAGVINDLIEGTIFYPWFYLITLIILLIAFVIFKLKKLIVWRYRIYNMKKWMKRYKKLKSFYPGYFSKH